jgi:predicted phosphodiesterase
MTKVLFVGDTHGDWSRLNQIIKYNMGKMDVIIQLGDFGFWPNPKNIRSGTYGLGEIDTKGLPLYWIDGNHEHHDHLKPILHMYGYDKPINIYGNIHYIPRGCRFDLGGKTTFLGCGGASSIDKEYRTNYIDWFKEEVPDYAECKDILEQAQPTDILLSHTVPNTSLKYMGDKIKLWFHDPTNGFLDAVVESYKIKKIYAGHWHNYYKIIHDTYTLEILSHVNYIDCNRLPQNIYENQVYKIEEFE